jgi:hypothetical protein
MDGGCGSNVLLYSVQLMMGLNVSKFALTHHNSFTNDIVVLVVGLALLELTAICRTIGR